RVEPADHGRRCLRPGSNLEAWRRGGCPRREGERGPRREGERRPARGGERRQVRERLRRRLDSPDDGAVAEDVVFVASHGDEERRDRDQYLPTAHASSVLSGRCGPDGPGRAEVPAGRPAPCTIRAPGVATAAGRAAPKWEVRPAGRLPGPPPPPHLPGSRRG